MSAGERVAVAFADAARATAFPQHGWAENPQGCRLLWFPLLQESRPEPGASVTLTRRSLALWNNLQKLVTVLGDMARIDELVAEQCGTDFGDWGEAALEAFETATTWVPVYVDFSFVLLKRVVNNVMCVSTPLLFDKWDQTPPRAYKLFSCTADQMAQWGPRVDVGELCELFHSLDWMRLIRPEAYVGKGIRDILEHREGTIAGSVQRDGDEAARIEATLIQHGQEPYPSSLIRGIEVVVAGCCDLMTDIVRLMSSRQEYQDVDCPLLLISGNTEHATRFWPAIVGDEAG